MYTFRRVIQQVPAMAVGAFGATVYLNNKPAVPEKPLEMGVFVPVPTDFNNPAEVDAARIALARLIEKDPCMANILVGVLGQYSLTKMGWRPSAYETPLGNMVYFSHFPLVKTGAANYVFVRDKKGQVGLVLGLHTRNLPDAEGKPIPTEVYEMQAGFTEDVDPAANIAQAVLKQTGRLAREGKTLSEIITAMPMPSEPVTREAALADAFPIDTARRETREEGGAALDAARYHSHKVMMVNFNGQVHTHVFFSVVEVDNLADFQATAAEDKEEGISHNIVVPLEDITTKEVDGERVYYLPDGKPILPTLTAIELLPQMMVDVKAGTEATREPVHMFRLEPRSYNKQQTMGGEILPLAPPAHLHALVERSPQSANHFFPATMPWAQQVLGVQEAPIDKIPAPGK